jgi:sporulation related protein
MEEQHYTDDQSHYEISLTAGQAFLAFVLLLLSLAASFAFGLMIGKGQADERLVVRKETPVITEGAMVPAKKESDSKIVELPQADDETAATETAAKTDTGATSASVIEEGTPAATETTANVAAATETTAPPPAAPAVPTFAQLLSTSDKKTAEVLAARVIERGFTSAYVERGSSDKGPVYRVRIKFPSEAEARAAEPKLKEFAKEVWITSR